MRLSIKANQIKQFEILNLKFKIEKEVVLSKKFIIVNLMPDYLKELKIFKLIY